MKAYILTDEQGYIKSFGSTDCFAEGIEIDIEESIFYELDKYKYVDGILTLDLEHYNQQLETINQYEQLNDELISITQWYKDHDYYPNKIITGEWLSTDQRWIDYLAERLVKRARYDEICELLNLDNQTSN